MADAFAHARGDRVDDAPAARLGGLQGKLVGVVRLHIDKDRLNFRIEALLRFAGLRGSFRRRAPSPRFKRLGRAQKARWRLEVGRDVVDRRQRNRPERKPGGVAKQRERKHESGKSYASAAPA